MADTIDVSDPSVEDDKKLTDTAENDEVGETVSQVDGGLSEDDTPDDSTKSEDITSDEDVIHKEDDPYTEPEPQIEDDNHVENDEPSLSPDDTSESPQIDMESPSDGVESPEMDMEPTEDMVESPQMDVAPPAVGASSVTTMAAEEPESYQYLDSDGIRKLATDIFNTVNTRITDRIINTIDETSDENHVPSGKTVFNSIKDAFNSLFIKTENHETVDSPEAGKIYIEPIEGSNGAYAMFIYDGDSAETDYNGYVAPGEYVFGKDDASFNSAYVSGGNQKTFNFANFKIADVREVSSSSIKLRKGEGTVKFKVLKDGTAEVTCTNHALTITPTDGGTTEITTSATTTISLAADVEYTIEGKETNNNSELQKIVITETVKPSLWIPLGVTVSYLNTLYWPKNDNTELKNELGINSLEQRIAAIEAQLATKVDIESMELVTAEDVTGIVDSAASETNVSLE